jgi:hypothetical protein
MLLLTVLPASRSATLAVEKLVIYDQKLVQKNNHSAAVYQ